MIIILPLKILIHVQVRFMFPSRKNSVLSVMCNCKNFLCWCKIDLTFANNELLQDLPYVLRKTLHTCTKQINYSKVLRPKTCQLFAQKNRLVSDCSLQKYNLTLTLSNENFKFIFAQRILQI
jgi:hypothetical protein